MARKKRFAGIGGAAAKGIARGKELAAEHGPKFDAAGEAIGRVAVEVSKTKTGKAAIKAGAGGAALGLALPVISAVTGALLGAGAVVIWRAMRDKD